MEKLIEKYNKECDIIKGKGGNIWRVGLIGLSILFLVGYVWLKKYLLIFLLTAFLSIVLYFICELKNVKCIRTKLKIKPIYVNKLKTIKDTYIELDRFQKEWISKYCKRNKINSIEKIKLIRECLKQKIEEKNKKYISPIIIATLSLTIWDVIVQDLYKKTEIINTIVISSIVAVIISLFIGFIKNEYREQKDLFNTFDKMTGYKRLDELLLYVAIKCNK